MKTKEQVFSLIEDIDLLDSEHGKQLLYSSDFLFIVHCWQGKLQVSVNQETYLIGQDHILVCLPTFLIGNYMRTPDCRCRVMCMDIQHFAHLIDATFHAEPRWWEKFTLLQQNPVIPVDEARKHLLNGYYVLMKAYLADEQNPFRERMMERLSEMAYYELSSYLERKVGNGPNDQISQPDRIFRRFTDMLRVEYITRREVQWYAEQLHITSKYLSTVCREKSGKPASEWIRDCLVEEIRKKLTETDIPVKELSFQFGFPSQSFFGKYVKHNLGSSPQAYRIANKII